MADNVTTQSAIPATPPSGTVIATDDVGGVQYQRIKLVDGTLDSTAAIPGDAANGLDVDVTRVSGVVHVDDNSGSLTVDGTVAITAADGGDVAQGALADAAVVTDVSGSLSGKLRGLVKWAFERMPASLGQKTGANSLPVVLPSDQTVPVSGTFWQGTQPVSGTFWQATQPVSGTFWQVTQPVSGTISAQGSDGINALTPKVQNRGGDNVLFTYDPLVVHLLEEILVELRVANAQYQKLLVGTQQADIRADLKLAQ